MGKFHYWLAVIAEISGCILILVAKCEIIFLHKCNPAELLIWMGCFFITAGGLYFTKFVNVKHFLK